MLKKDESRYFSNETRKEEKSNFSSKNYLSSSLSLFSRCSGLSTIE